MEVGYTKCIGPAHIKDLEQGRQSGRTGIEVNAILGVNAVYVPTVYVAIKQ
jgi:F0F1-type ATP synthase alpha subunit